jgi:hypothetical protein
MRRLLQVIEPTRRELGRIGLVGHGWDSTPRWAAKMQIEHIYYTDKAYLRRIGVDVLPAVSFEKVIAWMSKATFNPVLVRPTFAQMRLITPRFFETPAASTIPLFLLDEAHVRLLYGPEALELRLPDEGAEEKIVDVVRRPQYYGDIVRRIRRHLSEQHSHRARLQRLIEIIES